MGYPSYDGNGWASIGMEGISFWENHKVKCLSMTGEIETTYGMVAMKKNFMLYGTLFDYTRNCKDNR